MSFWNLSDGEDAKEVGTSFETGGGNMPPIPDGSSVLAAIDDAKWDTDRDGYEHINLRWRIQKPEQFANRVVSQKVWVSDDKPKDKDPQKARDKAKKMLAAIDANAGGKLARKATRPTSDDLALALIGKPMVIRVQVWEIDGKEGNWIAAVSPKDHELRIGETKASPKKSGGDDWGSEPRKGVSPNLQSDLDDEVPF